MLASIAIGSRSTSLAEVFGAFSAFDGSDEHVIVRELRVPRTELGLLVGAALGAAGALMQGVTRNPLAEPGILGINAGAALAVVLAISLAGIASTTAYAVVALAGAASPRWRSSRSPGAKGRRSGSRSPAPCSRPC